MFYHCRHFITGGSNGKRACFGGDLEKDLPDDNVYSSERISFNWFMYGAATSLLFLVFNCNKPPIHHNIHERWTMVTHVSTISSGLSSCMFHLNCVTAYPDSLCSFSFTSNYKRKSCNWVEYYDIAVVLLCFFNTSFSYFHVLRVIRRHQQQVQANAPSGNFGQPAINLAKYKKSVFTILYTPNCNNVVIQKRIKNKEKSQIGIN